MAEEDKKVETTGMIKFDVENALPAETSAALEAESQSNMEGVDARLPKVAMPTGRGKEFCIEDYEGEPIDVKEFTGIILFQTPANAYWKESFGDGNAVVPDCGSHDGVVPSPQYEDVQSDTCVKCVHNRFGSARNEKGEKLPGKACRNVKRVLILRTDQPDIPVMLTAPPSSIRSFNDYMVLLRKKKRPYYSVATKFSIKTESNKSGIDYPQVKFEIAGYINDAAQLENLKDAKKNWLEIIRTSMFTADDAGYVQEPLKDAPIDENDPVEF